jgi:hypothetical protein
MRRLLIPAALAAVAVIAAVAVHIQTSDVYQVDYVEDYYLGYFTPDKLPHNWILAPRNYSSMYWAGKKLIVYAALLNVDKGARYYISFGESGYTHFFINTTRGIWVYSCGPGCIEFGVFVNGTRAVMPGIGEVELVYANATHAVYRITAYPYQYNTLTIVPDTSHLGTTSRVKHNIWIKFP